MRLSALADSCGNELPLSSGSLWYLPTERACLVKLSSAHSNGVPYSSSCDCLVLPYWEVSLNLFFEAELFVLVPASRCAGQELRFPILYLHI